MLLGQVLVKVYSVIPMTFVEFMQNVGGGGGGLPVQVIHVVTMLGHV